MHGHTSIIEWLISNQMSSLDWAKVSTIRVLLSNCLTLSSNLCDFCISSTYKVSFFTFCDSRVWNFWSNFSFCCFCAYNSCDNLFVSTITKDEVMSVGDELGSVLVMEIVVTQVKTILCYLLHPKWILDRFLSLKCSS